ncbi:hypothetical protein niasHT_013528 [Heterodera trifolii]|uniref:Uncharacterized protein n=1 Tax=Heterodera trifolii TaxID=157864 RepID=A0ABD2LCV3_9BILA
MSSRRFLLPSVAFRRPINMTDDAAAKVKYIGRQNSGFASLGGTEGDEFERRIGGEREGGGELEERGGNWAEWNGRNKKHGN